MNKLTASKIDIDLKLQNLVLINICTFVTLWSKIIGVPLITPTEICEARQAPSTVET